MWLCLVAGLVMLLTAIAGARRVLPASIGLLSMAGFFCFHSRRECSMLAIMLKNEETGMLEQIASRGGPAGDAASMLLQERRSRSPGS
jgi:hypothetical protein